MSTFVTRLAATAIAVAAASVLVGQAAAQATDHDCGDFASQKAAQIFFLDAGGPGSDPHGLDSDGDGIACESNQAPYYTSTPPGNGGGGSGSGGTGSGSTTTRARVASIVDGDTLRLANGQSVRLIGIDTAESGECGFTAAKRLLSSKVSGEISLINPAGVNDRDLYGRLLRYVSDGKGDPGLALINAGLADARYDGLDGYQRHPRQGSYRAADASHPDRCR